MCKRMLTIRTTVLALVFVLILATAQPVFGVGSGPAQPGFLLSTEFKFTLTDAEIGWLRFGERLFRTVSNGAAWQDVTPSLDQNENLVDGFFLDSNHAFVLALSVSAEEWQLNLLKTVDAGTSWQAQPVTLPDQAEELSEVPFGNAFLQWQSDQNGWILIKQATSSNFSIGFLLRTVDGGQSWQVSEPPAAEDFVFMNEKLGFMRDPVDPARLFQTWDGGASWQSIHPLADNSVGGDLQRVGLPTFWRDGEYLLPAWFKRGETETELVFLAAQPDQQSQTDAVAWSQFSGTLNPQSWQDSIGSGLAINQISSFDGQSLWLGLTGSDCQENPYVGDTDLPQNSLSCENTNLLLSSDDGGGQWQEVNLPTEVSGLLNSGSLEGRFQELPQVDQRLNYVQWLQIYQGQGFDACDIPTLSELQAWFDGSPYQSVNLYIGGVSRACDNDALNAAYLQQMFNQGWRFIPTWVGPQAPCTTFKNRFSLDPKIAYTQGVDNANLARAKLMELGLTNPDGTGTVVYDDLEYFTYSATCSAAARAFVQGWSTRLQELGIVAGLYASSRNLDQNAIYNLQPPPYAAWIAEWYSTPGYRPDVTVWDVDWLDDIYWSNHQRVFQYSGSHDETWGAVTINVDSNVLDGIVAAPYGADLTAPVTSYSESGTIGIYPWYKTPVTVTLTATDNSVGVKHTYYRANLGNWNIYTGPVVVNWSGLVTIDYVSVDRVNNWESIKTASFYVDSQPPVNPRVTNPGCQAWNGVPQAYCNDPWFTWAGAYDLGVGLNPTDTYEFYWGTNPNATSGTRTTATQYNPPAIPTGVPYHLRIRTQDRHGLWSSWQTIFTLIYNPSFTNHYWLPRMGK